VDAADETFLGTNVTRPDTTAEMSLATRLFKNLLPPLVAYVLSRAMLHWAAISARHDPFTATAWSRWDSAHYLSIAEKGYEFFSCALMPGYDPKLWCGNCAWLPGYPLLTKLVAGAVHIQHVTAAVWISSAFTIASLLVIWNLFLNAQMSVGNLLSLALAAFFPGHVYDHAVFPISQFAFFELLSLWFYGQQRLALSAVSAAAAAFTYSSGLFLCGVFGLHAVLLDRQKPWLVRVKNVTLPCAGVLVGFSAVLWLQWFQTGHGNAFFLTQGKYAYAPRTPFEAWWKSFTTFLSDYPRIGGPSEQTLLVAGLCLMMLGFLVWRRNPTRLDLTLAAFTVVYWLVPIILGGQLSLYRAEATLLPAIPLARKVPWPILALLVFVAMVISRLMARQFFKGSIT
jgi:hypothetical protein